MGKEAIVRRDNGSRVKRPESQEDWPLLGERRAHPDWMLRDPLLDWLDLYREDRGYVSRP